MKIRTDYEDGNYWAVPYTPEHEAHGMAFVEMPDDEWQRYENFRALSREWHERIRELDAEQWDKDEPRRKAWEAKYRAEKEAEEEKRKAQARAALEAYRKEHAT